MKQMTIGSPFNGINGMVMGLERAGMKAVWVSEIDASCNQLMQDRRPDLPNKGDIRDVGKHNAEPVDLVCAGFPCQDLSIAGKRAGLAGERSGLWYELHRVLAELGPEWVVIENVPGLLSSCGCPTCGALRRILRVHKYLRHKHQVTKPCAICHAAGRMLKSHQGRDFAIILGGLVELGYGVAWRSFDVQYFGLAQRRQRVFIVGHLGDGRAAEILFEPEIVRGGAAPERKARADIARETEGCVGIGCEPGVAHVISTRGGNHMDPNGDEIIAVRMTQTGANGQGISENGTSHTLDGSGGDAVLVSGTQGAAMGRNGGLGNTNEADLLIPVIAHPLTVDNHGAGHEQSNFVIEALDARHGSSNGDIVGTIQGGGKEGHGYSLNQRNPIVFGWQDGSNGQIVRQTGLPNVSATKVPAITSPWGVRRLTPLEEERLQGFPDNWTAGFSDSTRYRMLGNACPPVFLEWIGRRILEATARNPPSAIPPGISRSRWPMWLARY